MKLNCNMGKADRIIRAILGTAIVAAGFLSKSWWGAVGLAPIITAALGWCPAYAPFGFSTVKKK